jgi:alkylhydroperoxidase family enzyme
MALIKTVKPKDAQGGMKNIYNSFLDAVGMIPPPLMISSSSPTLQALKATIMHYYSEHPRLSPKLIALIRYITSVIFDAEPCIQFNVQHLKMLGVKEKQIEELGTNGESVPLDERESALYQFVVKALKKPEAVSGEDIENLRELDWTDADIFDALNAASNMIGPGVIMKALKVE